MEGTIDALLSHIVLGDLAFEYSNLYHFCSGFLISAVDFVTYYAMLAAFFGVVITIFIVLLDTLNQDMGISDVAQEK